jgi:hypothetical protein
MARLELGNAASSGYTLHRDTIAEDRDLND